MAKFIAEKTNNGHWHLYRVIRVNGESEERYVATVQADSEESAIAQGGAAMRESASVAHMLNH